MLKSMFFLIVMSLMTNFSLANNTDYFMTHLNELQKAIKQCPEKQPTAITCEQLERIAIQANSLADELRYSPQDFGQKILALQEARAKLSRRLEKNATQPETQALLNKNKRSLVERLAVVKWLESPRG